MRPSLRSSGSQEGNDQVEFFNNVIAYLQMRIGQDLKGTMAKQVDQKLDQDLLEQINYLQNMLQENQNGANFVKGLSANNLEHLLKSLLPIVRISHDKFLIGTTIKPVQIKSEKLQVLVGGGAVTFDKHWRQVAVSETIKLNKMISTVRKPVSQVVKGMLEQAGANA